MKTRITEEKYEELAETFEAAIDSHVEYETEHADAGSNYSHLPREGGWDYSNGEDRLREWIKENDLTIPKGDNWDDLVDEVLDWCEIEPGHVFSGGTTKEKFIVDSYPVGEIEDQYCLPDLANLLDISEDETREFVALAMEDHRFCLRENGDGGVLSYTSTDAVWIFYIDRKWITSRLEGMES